MDMPTLIMCAGGNRRFAEAAIANGWQYGSRLPGYPTTSIPIYFADQDWRKPARGRYIAALEQHRPRVATVLDLERASQFDEVMAWANDAAHIVPIVVVIPKVFGIIDRIPERIGTADVVLGYSVPTIHGGTPVPIWEFGRRPVHLLGGSPKKQMELAMYLNVVSADGNMASKMATGYCKFWYRGRWEQLTGYGQDAPYAAFELSMKNIMEAWKCLF
jgi:hypothetical protein